MASTSHKSERKKMRSISRWYISETLGKGGYSFVKKGFDKKTGKFVALKFIPKADEQWSKGQKKQVQTEIESLKQIRHSNVMRLYAYNLDAKYPTNTNEKIDCVLLVLEFCPGGELFDLLYYTSALEPILSRTYFRQSIFALEACHKVGIAHRDIKAQNLLLDSRFNVKLTDFGLSKIFESEFDKVMTTTYVGTRGYQAPELLLDKPYDLSSDIFSMGVVLFLLITGYPPFEQAHYSDRWFRAIAKGDYAKFWKCHAGCTISNDIKCQDLLNKMLAYDPKQRITIEGIKKHIWFNDKYLQGKELIRALRYRHREMEAKRRRDGRKVKDLQVSIKRVRCIGHNLNIKYFPDNNIEHVNNCYCHFEEPKEFFELLTGLVHNCYGGQSVYDVKEEQMICTITKMEKLLSDKNGKAIKCDYKFSVKLYKSKEYVTEKTENHYSSESVDNIMENEDYIAHTCQKYKYTVYVVVINRISGDDFKFRAFYRLLLQNGAQLFNGLPEWAIKTNNDDAFDILLKKWDENESKEDDYDDIQW